MNREDIASLGVGMGSRAGGLVIWLDMYEIMELVVGVMDGYGERSNLSLENEWRHGRVLRKEGYIGPSIP